MSHLKEKYTMVSMVHFIKGTKLFDERYQGETTKRVCHGLMTHPHALFYPDYYSYTASTV